MLTELVHIETDGIPLDGVLYRPEGSTRGAVQLMHGNTMNFYVGPPRFLPPLLTQRGWTCLAYNRRGHDVLSNRDSRRLEGGAYQTIAQASADNEYARSWLADLGFPSPVVVGHSNGGTLGVAHVASHPDTPALVLLSAHRGGVDLMRRLAERGLMAGDDYEAITSRALRLVEEGRPDTLMLVPGWWYVISAGTYVEYLRRCPDVLELAPSIDVPTLYLVGDSEPEDLYPARAFRERAPGPVTVEVVGDCDHYYTRQEDAVAASVARFLDSLGT
ncbi:MAG: alpha/beta hydrolase [Actinomycetota bacterium]